MENDFYSPSASSDPDMNSAPDVRAESSTYGGSLLRLEYEEMERRNSPLPSDATRPTKLFENIIVGVGFGAVTLLVTMVLVAVGTAI